MQAIFETLFDVVYLVTVITLGILMIRSSKGKKQYFLFGVMAFPLSGREQKRTYNHSMGIGAFTHRSMSDATKCMDQHRSTAIMGNLSKHPVYNPWCSDSDSFLS